MTRRSTIVVLIAACGLASFASADPPAAAARTALAETLSRLVRDAIPLRYEKQQDWGATREITSGYKVEGKPFHVHVHRRKHALNHGVWKHYKLRVIDPERSLRVHVSELRPLEGGRMGFTLTVDARLDAWARAKAYQYGVHLLALEFEGDMRLKVELQGEVGLRAVVANGAVAMAVEPRVLHANVSLDELNIRRVSNAHGPIIRELSDGVRSLAEDELDSPRLTAKINAAIDKRRESLIFAPADLIDSGWRPLSAASSEAPTPR